jgi:hypothetical protein
MGGCLPHINRLFVVFTHCTRSCLQNTTDSQLHVMIFIVQLARSFGSWTWSHWSLRSCQCDESIALCEVATEHCFKADSRKLILQVLYRQQVSSSSKFFTILVEGEYSYRFVGPNAYEIGKWALLVLLRTACIVCPVTSVCNKLLMVSSFATRFYRWWESTALCEILLYILQNNLIVSKNEYHKPSLIWL